MRLLVAGVLLLLALGCSPKRTELGYGFYQLEKPAGNIIRRERDENGQIVDVTWYPDRVIDESNMFVFGVRHGNTQYFGTIPADYKPDPELPRTFESVVEMLRSTVVFHALHLDRAEIERVGTYNDFVLELDEEDPLRMTFDGGLGLIAWFGSSSYSGEK